MLRKSQSIEASASLPSLNALRAFEAVGRTGSVTAAAAALCVTQGAVSRQLGALQAWFGRELARRRGRSLELTESGKELLEATSFAFSVLEEACARIGGRGGQPLQVAAPGSFLARWLVPRLESLEAGHPELRVALRTGGSLADLAERRIDALVACGRGPWPDDLDETGIAPERIGPVCAPALAPRWAGLARLSTESRPGAWKEWDRLAGNRGTRPAARRFDHLVPLLEAVRAGLGIAVVPELLVRREIASGEIVAPLGFLESGQRFSLLRRSSRRGDRALGEFAEWIAAAGVAETESVKPPGRPGAGAQVPGRPRRRAS